MFEKQIINRVMLAVFCLLLAPGCSRSPNEVSAVRREHEVLRDKKIPDSIRAVLKDVPAECERVISGEGEYRSVSYPVVISGRCIGRFHSNRNGPVFDKTSGVPAYTFHVNRDVDDIAVLLGMHIRHLRLAGRPDIEDLSPLRGMELVSLDLDGTAVEDISVLAGMPLELLQLSDTTITDLSPLKGSPLRSLYLDRSAVTDLSPLRGLPLIHLSAISCKIAELSPLRGAPLTWLDLSFSAHIEDLEPLRGMPLSKLDVRGSAVTDLSPLTNSPLRHLELSGCKHLSDLSALSGLGLRSLGLRKTAVTDLTPLEGRALELIRISPHRIKRGMDVLREMTTLQRIGTEKALYNNPDSFWRAYDKGAFGSASGRN